MLRCQKCGCSVDLVRRSVHRHLFSIPDEVNGLQHTYKLNEWDKREDKVVWFIECNNCSIKLRGGLLQHPPHHNFMINISKDTIVLGENGQKFFTFKAFGKTLAEWSRINRKHQKPEEETSVPYIRRLLRSAAKSAINVS